MNWRNRTYNMRAGWILASVLMIAVTAFELITVPRLVVSSAMVAHTHEVQQALTKLFSLMQDVESAQRGFLVTQNASMLQPYRVASEQVEPQLRRIRHLTHGSADQQRRLDQLEPIVRERMQLAAAVLEMANTAGLGRAREEIAGGTGLRLMEEIRRSVVQMEAHEQELLSAQMEAARRSSRIVSVAVPIGFATAVLILAFAFYASRKQNRELENRVRDRTSELETSLASLRDEVVERQRAEASLRESEADLLRARDELERRVAERTEELQRSNHELEQFAYVASHDLQEPLRAIAGCVQIVQRRYESKIDSQGHELIGHTVAGVARMKELIEGLLAYSRVSRSAGKVGPVSASAAVQAAVENVQLAVRDAKAELRYAELPMVLVDHGQLVQLFQNLIGNALKYRAEKPPVIEISAKKAGPMWEFALSDNGIGIEPQYFDRVFTIFQRLHTREEYPGTGIGLAICKKIVERAGGSIWIESQIREGSTFRFTLPGVS